MVSSEESELRSVVPLCKLRAQLAVLHLCYAKTVVAVEVVGVRQLKINHVLAVGVGLVEQLLHEVILKVARALLQLRLVVIQHYVVLAVLRLYVYVALNVAVVVWQERVARCSGAQVAEVAERERRERRKLFCSVVEVNVRRAFLICAAIPKHCMPFACVCLSAGGKGGRERVESDCSAKGVRAVVERRRTEKHLHVFQRKLVNGEAVLQVSASIYKVVHPYAVDNEQYSRCLKSSQDRTSAALLALLHEHLSRFAEQVGSRLPVGIVDKALRHAHNVLRSVDFACLLSVYRHNNLLQVDRAECVDAVGRVCLSLCRAACNDARNRNNSLLHVGD